MRFHFLAFLAPTTSLVNAADNLRRDARHREDHDRLVFTTTNDFEGNEVIAFAQDSDGHTRFGRYYTGGKGSGTCLVFPNDPLGQLLRSHGGPCDGFCCCFY